MVESAQVQKANQWRFFIYSVKDIKEHLKIIESNGGKVIMPYTVIPDMAKIAMFSDPEGNVVGLVE